METLLTPHEPARVLSLKDIPQSIASTSDGQLGFIALRGGVVDMLGVPEHQIIQTFSVGNTPQFIIIGLYTPTQDPLPRQVPNLTPLSSIMAKQRPSFHPPKECFHNV